MNNRINAAMKALLLLLAVACGKAGAQEVVLHQKFLFGEEGFGSDFYLPQNYPDTRFPKWEFSNCYDIKNTNLQVGSKSGTGYVKTPELEGLTEYVLVTLEAGNTYDSSRDVLLSAGDNPSCVLSPSTVKIPAHKDMRLSSILQVNGAVNPQLKISSDNSAFDLKEVTVTNIGNVLFYEFFNKVDGNNGLISFTTENTFFENKNYSQYFESESVQKGCGKGNGCIYLQSFQDDNNYFTTAKPQSAPTGKVLLRFRAAGANTTSTVSVELEGPSGVKFDTSTFYPTKEVWTQYEVVVTGYTKDSQITFKGSRVFLDDILITEIPTITLRETATDDNTITYNVSGLRTVQLKRTLGAGYWNTLCLPFNVTKTMLEQAFGSDANPVINTLASVDNGVFNFTTAESVPAGTPFLLKVSTPVTDPTFTEVTITQATPLTVSPNNDGYGFAGTYSKYSLEIDGTNLFLGTDGNLYRPAEGENVMNGLRAYFTVPSGSYVRVAADESGNELGIESVTANTQEHIIYNMMGQTRQSSNLTRGIYIINGKKTIVR